VRREENESVFQQPLRIAGIAVGRVRDGKLADEWGAGAALPLTAD
jgi:hypothetical protein